MVNDKIPNAAKESEECSKAVGERLVVVRLTQQFFSSLFARLGAGNMSDSADVNVQYSANVCITAYAGTLLKSYVLLETFIMYYFSYGKLRKLQLKCYSQ